MYFVDNGPKTIKLFLNQESVNFNYIKSQEPIEILE